MCGVGGGIIVMGGRIEEVRPCWALLPCVIAGGGLELKKLGIVGLCFLVIAGGGQELKKFLCCLGGGRDVYVAFCNSCWRRSRIDEVGLYCLV